MAVVGSSAGVATGTLDVDGVPRAKFVRGALPPVSLRAVTFALPPPRVLPVDPAEELARAGEAYGFVVDIIGNEGPAHLLRPTSLSLSRSRSRSRS